MSLSLGARWSGKGISNGRLRLIVARPAARQYSLSTSSISASRSLRRTFNDNLHNSQQRRNLSLFGWGSSSKPKTDEIPAGASSGSDSTAGVEATRTVKASLGTSDAPDPLTIQSHPVTSIEPEVVTAVQDAITLPSTANIPTDAPPDVDLTQIPERIGYLKEICGLDFGWGPTATLQFCLEHLHISAGLGWSTSIIALAFGIRILLFPLAARASDQGAKMRALAPVLKPLRAEYNDAAARHDKQKMLQVAAEIKAITKEGGASLWQAFAPILIQIPLQFGGFRLLRAAAMVPVPAFEAEKWLWTHDLTVADPFIVPVITSALTYYSLSQGIKNGTSNAGATFTNIMQYGLPAMNLVFMMFQPGAVQLFFLVNSGMSLVQQELIRNKVSRKLLGLGELPAPATKTAVAESDPGGLSRRMNRLSDPAPTTTPTSGISSEASDRSMIDKAVDAFKERKDSIVKSVKDTKNTVMGSAEEKAVERQSRAKREQIERYEAKRRQDLEIEREYRNKATTSAITSGTLKREPNLDINTEGRDEIGGLRLAKNMPSSKKARSR